MKKAKLTLAAVLAFVIGIFCLCACNAGAGRAGKYYFASVKMRYGGAFQEYSVGDTTPNGVVAKRDTIYFQLKSNGEVKVTSKETGETMEGTWEILDEEENMITIIIDDDPLDCYCDGSTLILYFPDDQGTATFQK